MSTRRQITYDVDRQKADLLDITVFKGPRFESEGVVDISFYRKPSSGGMHLARCSHHPQHTFKAIMNNIADRVLIACTDRSDWLITLEMFARELEVRGYGEHEIWKCLFERNKHEDRTSLISRTAGKDDIYEGHCPDIDILALKLPYTARLKQLKLAEFLRELRDSVDQYPTIRTELNNSKWLIAMLRTSSLLGLVKRR